LFGSGANTRTACGLHTHKLWKSHADANGESDCDSHSYCNCLAYGYSYCYCYSDVHAYTDTNTYKHTETNPDAKRYGFPTAAADPAASPVNRGYTA
jgi:hypothetical protein